MKVVLGWFYMTPTKSDKAAKPSSERSRRVIKRYSNRKLYDTVDSRYVTLLQIADMVRAGEDVQIIDNASKEDKTEVTLALIISEELKVQPRAVPLGMLRELIQERGGRLLSQLREGRIGRLIPGGGDGGVGSEPGGDMASQQRAEEATRPGQDERPNSAIDDRIRSFLQTFSGLTELRAEVDRLAERLAALEARLGHRDRKDEEPK